MRVEHLLDDHERAVHLLGAFGDRKVKATQRGGVYILVVLDRQRCHAPLEFRFAGETRQFPRPTDGESGVAGEERAHHLGLLLVDDVGRDETAAHEIGPELQCRCRLRLIQPVHRAAGLPQPGQELEHTLLRLMRAETEAVHVFRRIGELLRSRHDSRPRGRRLLRIEPFGAEQVVVDVKPQRVHFAGDGEALAAPMIRGRRPLEEISGTNARRSCHTIGNVGELSLRGITRDVGIVDHHEIRWRGRGNCSDQLWIDLHVRDQSRLDAVAVVGFVEQLDPKMDHVEFTGVDMPQRDCRRFGGAGAASGGEHGRADQYISTLHFRSPRMLFALLMSRCERSPG